MTRLEAKLPAPDSDAAPTARAAAVDPDGRPVVPTLDGLVSTPAADDQGDGRTMRRVRNRERVIMASLELIRAGNSAPSVSEIADRAEISHRSIFRYFDDLDDLLRSSIEFAVQSGLPLAAIADIGQGPLDARIDSFIESRLRIFRSTHEIGRLARNRSDIVPALQETVRSVYATMREQARTHFAPELSALDPCEAELTLDAVEVMAGFGAYDTQRAVFDHGHERIRQVWTRALHAVLRH